MSPLRAHSVLPELHPKVVLLVLGSQPAFRCKSSQRLYRPTLELAPLLHSGEVPREEGCGEKLGRRVVYALVKTRVLECFDQPANGGGTLPHSTLVMASFPFLDPNESSLGRLAIRKKLTKFGGGELRQLSL